MNTVKKSSQKKKKSQESQNNRVNTESKLKKILFFIIALVAFMSCDKKQNNILSSGTMEDVLYDYHLAQGMIEQLSPDDREKMAQAYIDAVYKKHNITEAEFDSSLLWYNRHTEVLNKIYSNLQERYTESNEKIALLSGSSEMLSISSQNGDTTNIWNSNPIAILRSKPGVNVETFNFSADTTYRQKDRFTLICTPVFFQEQEGNNDYFVNIGFTLKYKGGKTIGSTMRCSGTRTVQLNLNADEEKDIESISGYFYYKANDDSRNFAIISNIGIVRMHTNVVPTDNKTDEMADKPDSVETDSVKKPFERPRLSVEEMREQNHTENRNRIKTAPDVRTPNSFGPRRRIAKPAKRQ